MCFTGGLGNPRANDGGGKHTQTSSLRKHHTNVIHNIISRKHTNVIQNVIQTSYKTSYEHHTKRHTSDRIKISYHHPQRILSTFGGRQSYEHKNSPTPPSRQMD